MGKNHPTLYRISKNQIQPATTLQNSMQDHRKTTLCKTIKNHRPASKSMKISKNQSTGQARICYYNIKQAKTIQHRTEQSTGHARIYHYNISHARTIQHRTEPSRALRSCHIHAKVATSILKWQESCRTCTCHNHRPASKSRKIFKNQSTGQARIYHYNIKQAKTIQHRTEPSRALRTCHINARVAKTILKWQESSRTSHNHHAVSKSRQISKNQSTSNARIYHYNISHARTIQHRTEASRALRTSHIRARVATTILKCQETSRTGHNQHAVSKSRKISKNQSTGQARIYHYNMK